MDGREAYRDKNYSRGRRQREIEWQVGSVRVKNVRCVRPQTRGNKRAEAAHPAPTAILDNIHLSDCCCGHPYKDAGGRWRVTVTTVAATLKTWPHCFRGGTRRRHTGRPSPEGTPASSVFVSALKGQSYNMRPTDFICVSLIFKRCTS